METMSLRRFVEAHPLLFILIVGTVVRIVLMPTLTYCFDSDYFAFNMRNGELGEDLYSVRGYYYFPTWGYILFAWVHVLEVFPWFADMGTLVPEVAFTGGFDVYNGMATSPAFNFGYKSLILIFDIFLSWAVYLAVLRLTGDRKKAVIGFAICYLSPATIAICAVSGFFDGMSALFTIIAIMFIYRGNNFLAGVSYGIAVLIKFIPIFLIVLLVTFIIRKYRGTGQVLKQLTLAILGGAFAFAIVMAGPLMNGQAMNTISFLVDRVSNVGMGASSSAFLDRIIDNSRLFAYSAILIFQFLVGYKVLRSETVYDEKQLMLLAAILMGITMLYPPTPQYTMMYIPLFIVVHVCYGGGMKWQLWLLFIGVCAFSLFNLPFMLQVEAAYMGLPIGTLESILDAYTRELFLGLNGRTIVMVLTGALQYAGILATMAVLAGYYRDEFRNPSIGRAGLIDALRSRFARE